LTSVIGGCGRRRKRPPTAVETHQVKNKEILSISRKRDRIRLYLTAMAAGCEEVATTPSPKMVATIRGVLQLASRTIREIEREAAVA
jgi:hypothetical protein